LRILVTGGGNLLLLNRSSRYFYPSNEVVKSKAFSDGTVPTTAPVDCSLHVVLQVVCLPEHVYTGFFRSLEGDISLTLYTTFCRHAMEEPLRKDCFSIKQEDTLLDAGVTSLVDHVVVDLS
jgi:hypothetical protein